MSGSMNLDSQTRMTHDEIRRNTEIRMTNGPLHTRGLFDIRASDFFRHLSFVICHSTTGPRSQCVRKKRKGDFRDPFPALKAQCVRQRVVVRLPMCKQADLQSMRLFLLILVAGLGCYGAAPETGAKKLREVVRLPTIDFAFSLKFQSGNGWTLSVVGAEEDSSAEIATLRKELRGDISDAERFTRLKELYAKANDKTNSQAAAAKALELWRRRVELQPDNGRFLAELGRSLAGAEKYVEAESVLRKATTVAPAEWKCWIALGTFLDAKAHRTLGSDSLQPGENLFAGIFGKPPSANQVKEAEKLFDEAGECFNKAVTTAPKEAEAYFERAVH